MKKSLVLALVAVLVLSFAGAAFAFTDTTSHWANAYINKLVDAKVVSGTTATTFVPDGKVTRAEFAKMIVGAKGLALENPTTATFSDVATTAWYFPYVEAAAKAKLVDGTGAGKFDPTALVTREQVAKMVVLAAGLKADDTKAINFDDKASISDWAKGYVAVAADAKLITGYNNKFSPKSNATRAEAAKLVYEEMLYEGKITPVAEVLPAGYMKVTKTPTATLVGSVYEIDAIELDGTEYTVKNQNFKIAGEYVNDGRLFIDNTLVKVVMNSDDEVLSIEADPKVVKGEVNGKGTISGDKALTVDGKDVTWVDDADYVPALTNPDSDIFGYNEISAGDKVIVLLNNEGLGYAALSLDSVTVKGALTSAGTTNDDEFYFVVDGKKYLSEKDQNGANAATQPDIDFEIYTNAGAKQTTYAALETLMNDDAVAEIETNASGLVTKVTAYAKEINGVPTFGTPTSATFDGKKYENLLTLGAITIGEKGGVGTTVYAQENFRALNGSAVVTVNGTTVDFADIQDELDGSGYSATATVNGAGEVVKIVITDDSIYGQISAFRENDNNEVTYVTINSKEYKLATEVPNDNDVIKKGFFVYGTIETDGDLKLIANPTLKAVAPQFEYTVATSTYSTSKFQQYVVIATTFVQGYDPAKDNGTNDNTNGLVTGGVNNVRLQNVDTGAYYNVKVDTFVKADDDVKLNTVKAGDTVVIVDTNTLVAPNANLEFAVIAPITSTR